MLLLFKRESVQGFQSDGRSEDLQRVRVIRLTVTGHVRDPFLLLRNLFQADRSPEDQQSVRIIRLAVTVYVTGNSLRGFLRKEIIQQLLKRYYSVVILISPTD